MMDIKSIIDDCRLMQPNHEGNNVWPSIRMGTVTALCDEVERLQKQCEELADALKKLERLSGSAMMSDDPARVGARKALENYRGGE